jgi:hypothetical protein
MRLPGSALLLVYDIVGLCYAGRDAILEVLYRK